MNLFKIFANNEQGGQLFAPIKGKCVPLTDVPDDVFSTEQIGKGIAIIPTDGNIYAPVDGIISSLFPTGHAIGFTTKDGAEILLHIGLDTVELNGEPFEIKVEQGQKVNRGDLLIVADLAAIEKAGKNPITMLMVCEPNNFEVTGEKLNQQIQVGDPVVKYTRSVQL